MADEYIKRISVVVRLKRWQDTLANTYGKNDEHVKCLEDAVNIVESVPAADAIEVRHGHWIEREDMYYGWNIWECSLCREEFCVEEGTPKDNEYNYCPNCGANMEGGQDDV